MGIYAAAQAQEAPAVQPFAAPSAPSYDEKKQATEDIRPVPQYYESEDGPVERPEAEWNPGFVARFP